MDTAAVLENGRTYLPVRYVAESLGAVVDLAPNTGTVTITSETKELGGFTIPKSYTDAATDISGIRATSFALNTREPARGYTNLENKVEMTLFIFSQKLSADTIDKLKAFADAHVEFQPNHSYDFVLTEFMFGETMVVAYGNTWMDSRSGQYVHIMRQYDDILDIMVFDVGAMPPNPQS